MAVDDCMQLFIIKNCQLCRNKVMKENSLNLKKLRFVYSNNFC